MKSLAEHLGTAPPKVEAPPQDVWTLCDKAMTGEEFALLVVNSREYRQSILHRIILGELAAAVEVRLLDYAYGTPVKRLELKDTTDDVDEMDVDECEREAMRLLEIARQLRAESAKPVDREAVH